MSRRKKKKYVYPQFSRYEFFGIRLGGAGLGNLLFIYSRAIIYEKKNDLKMIWPTWTSVHIGPWIRRERDRRSYHNLFRPYGEDITGIHKYLLLFFCRSQVEIFNYDNSAKITFRDIMDSQELIKTTLIKRISENNLGVKKHSFDREINIHVRRGDFRPASQTAMERGDVNTATPIEWFVSIVKQLSVITDDKIIFNVFSDGSNMELQPLLNLPNVRRVAFGTSVADIVALSSSRLIIASGSSFSLWARFLGQQNCIACTKQLKENVLLSPLEDDFEIEVGMNESIPDCIKDRIKKSYDMST